MLNVESICKHAKRASRPLALILTEKKDRALTTLSEWLLAHQNEIIRENYRTYGEVLNYQLEAISIMEPKEFLEKIKSENNTIITNT